MKKKARGTRPALRIRAQNARAGKEGPANSDRTTQVVTRGAGGPRKQG